MNKPHITFLLAVVGLMTAASAQATVLSSTSFGGSAASPTGNTGFSSTIYANTAGGGTASSATFTAGNLTGTTPAAYTSTGFTNTGNYVSTVGTPAFATLSTSMPNEIPTTRYFSFLYSFAAVNNALNGGGLNFYSGTNDLFQVGVGNGGSGTNIRIAPTGGTASNTTNNISTGVDAIFITGKIQTGVGADTISLRFYKGADILSATEDWSGPQSLVNSTATFVGNVDTIRVNSPSGQTAQQFDEFRFGDTYASVTAIPEPSSYATFAGLAGLALVGLRRRRAAR